MESDQIKAQGLKSISDVLDYTPGVINSQGEGHRATRHTGCTNNTRSIAMVFETMYNIIVLCTMSRE